MVAPARARHPKPLLEVRVKQLKPKPGLVAVCAGYESGKWRARQLAGNMIKWLPDFALRDSERESIGSDNAVEMVARAAHAVYTSEKYQRRGEPGELLLHMVLRQVFKTVPAVTKVFFKDASNVTVKGFDAVHVVATQSRLELWLGEVKFYRNITAAIRDVVTELKKHTEHDYLRSEFAAICNKIDPAWPQAERLKKLLDPDVSLDVIFDRLCVPVLLTYDSPTIAAHRKVTTEFLAAFESEVADHHKTFQGKSLPRRVTVHLMLLPMRSKTTLVGKFDSRLKKAQAMV